MPRSTRRVPFAPGEDGTTVTDVVVIGSGMGGLAVATHLHRKGVAVVVLDGLAEGDAQLRATLRHATTEQLERVAACDPVSHDERREILRQLHGYTKSHAVDIRRGVVADALDTAGAHGADAPLRRWVLHTPTGVILCDSLVITGANAHHPVRRFLHGLGQETGESLSTALRRLGIYLVGVGQQVSAGHREVLQQARLVGNTIAGNGLRLPA
ncbi:MULTISPECIES: FAD-binding oxidoreductase [Arthrobacter]|uniref:FAD-dependent oxidoreductase n=2 Tax=Arthrobacter TaxID=1663 RepID=A0ABU9KJ24_9MICC|nr:FAD-binding oxidoreductase [Arthrobacter sp. YJM1]MDP5226403.1 FAD-dependent oxidoreductase [Arthrobacter sp. YJM1]